MAQPPTQHQVGPGWAPTGGWTHGNPPPGPGGWDHVVPPGQSPPGPAPLGHVPHHPAPGHPGTAPGIPLPHHLPHHLPHPVPHPLPHPVPYATPRPAVRSLALGVIWFGVAAAIMGTLMALAGILPWLLINPTGGIAMMLAYYPGFGLAGLVSVIGHGLLLGSIWPLTRGSMVGYGIASAAVILHILAGLIWAGAYLDSVLVSGGGPGLAGQEVLLDTVYNVLWSFWQPLIFGGWLILLWLPATRESLRER